jgi:hypothetical protein
MDMGLIIFLLAVLFLMIVLVFRTLLEEIKKLRMRLDEKPRDESIGPEGYRDGEEKDVIWLDQSLRKVRWCAKHKTWELVKRNWRSLPSPPDSKERVKGY